MPPVEVPVRRLENARGLSLPAYETAHAAGLDLMAAIDADLSLAPGRWQAIPTGIALALPPGYEGQVRPRSGLAARHGVTVLNAPGTIDADYRGEIKALLINLGDQPFVIARGMRIAQLVITPVARVAWREAEALADSGRGTGGFGSTGLETRPAITGRSD